MHESQSPRELCDRYRREKAQMLVAYLPCWPFEAEYCSHCDEVVTYWGAVKTAIWQVLVGWYWSGAVKVTAIPFRRPPC